MKYKKLGNGLKTTSILFTFCIGLLILFLLNPVMSYAHSTTHQQVTIFHQEKQLDTRILGYINRSLSTIATSELYDSSTQFSLCLNDGSIYPNVVETILGSDVFTAFTNKVVVLGDLLEVDDRFSIWNEELCFSQFLSHGLVHNLQYNHHGFWDSNPLGNHEQWKWEGYVEYVVLGQDRTLEEWLAILDSNETNPYDFVDLGNGRKTIRRHVEYLTLVKYILEEKGYNYNEFMAIDTSEEELIKELSLWNEPTLDSAN